MENVKVWSKAYLPATRMTERQNNYPGKVVWGDNYQGQVVWCRGVVVITTAQFHSTRPELRFWASSNLARGMSEIRDDEDLNDVSEDDNRAGWK